MKRSENYKNFNLSEICTVKEPNGSVLLNEKVQKTSGFVIPKLKTDTSTRGATTPSQFNSFIVSQLEKNSEKQSSKTEFTVPKLGLPINFAKEILTPYEQSMKKIIQSKINENNKHNVNQISDAVNNISLNDGRLEEDLINNKLEVIDLTSALNIGSNSLIHPKRNLKATVTIENFTIPFIDCDLQKVIVKHTNSDNINYKVNGIKLKATKFGKITSMKYRRPQLVQCIDHSFNPKHRITPFHFNTKSPDDTIFISQKK